jgi:hypothetical protein
MALRNLLVRIGADITPLAKGLNAANSQLNKFKNEVKKLPGISKGLLLIGGAIASALALKGPVEDAMKYEALMGTLSESLQGNMKQFQKWQESTGASMGYSKLQSAELANMLSLNFKKISKDTADLTQKTTTMMETAAVISNKRGMAMSEVSDRIRSAMNQEADGADELGVNVRVAAVEQSNAYKMMGASGPWDKLSENMRKTILYYHVLEQVNKNLGTSLQDTTQLRMSQFTAALGDVKLALGNAFLPIVSTVLPYLTTFMRYIESALGYVYAFTQALFGTKKLGAVKSNTQAVNNQASAVNNLGGATDSTAKKTAKAAKANKKAAQDNLQSFDQVHQLAEATADAGASAGGGGGGGAIATPPAPPVNQGLDTGGPSAWDRMGQSAVDFGNKIKDFLANSQAVGIFRKAWGRLTSSFEDFWHSKGVQGAMGWLAGGWDLGFEGVMMIGAGAVDILSGALEALNYLLNGDTTHAWKAIGRVLRGVAEILSGTFGPLFPSLAKKFNAFTEKFFDGWDAIGDINYAELMLRAFKVFDDLKTKATTKLNEIVDAMPGITGLISVGFHVGLSALSGWFKTNVTDKIINLLGGTAKPAGDKSSSIYGAIKGEFKDVYGWFRDHVGVQIGKGLSQEKEYITGKASSIWSGIKGKFSDAKSWFGKYVSGPIGDKLSDLKKSVSGGITSAFKSSYNSAAGWINKMIGYLNTTINKLNALPIISGIPTVKTKLPYLAQGGITTGPTLAMVGDNPGGREVISPLDDLKSMIATAVTTAMAVNGGGGNTGGDIVLKLDGRQFARLMKPYMDQEQRRIGANVKLQTI